jgi:hypothetical protein
MGKFQPVDWTNERVQRILNAAWRCLERRTFEECSTADIAREAKLSKGLLHYYFESKEHLFLELQAWVYYSLVRRIEAAVAARSPGSERALAALDELWQLMKTSRREFMLLEQIAHRSMSPEGDLTVLRQFYAAAVDLFIGEMKLFLGPGKSFDATRLRDIALMCLSTLQGMMFLQHTGLAGCDLDGAYQLFRGVLGTAGHLASGPTPPATRSSPAAAN